MSTPFPSGQAIQSALQSFARRNPQPNEVPPTHVWVLQRLVARLARDPEQNWAIKGAQALLIRLPDAPRATRDIDAMVSAPSMEAALEAFTRLVETRTPDEDFLTFTVVSHKAGAFHPDLLQVKVDVRMESGSRVKRLTPVGADILIADRLTTDTDTLYLHPRIDIGRFTDWPQVRVVSTAQHIAEKLAAMYTLHSGKPSSRTHDFTDIVMLLEHEPPTQDALVRALHATAAATLPPNNTLAFPDRLTVPQASIDHYRSLPGLPPIEEALTKAEELITPALERFHAEQRAMTSVRHVLDAQATSRGTTQETAPQPHRLPPDAPSQGRRRGL